MPHEKAPKDSSLEDGTTSVSSRVLGLGPLFTGGMCLSISLISRLSCSQAGGKQIRFARFQPNEDAEKCLLGEF